MAILAFSLRVDGAPPATTRQRFWEGGLRGAAFGTAANVVALRFVPDVIARFTPLPWAVGVVALVLLSIEQSARWAVVGLLTSHLSRRGVPRWLAFGAAVFLGSFVPVVFPWTAAGGATPWPELVQLAELVGERGVTLVMALTSGLAAEAIALALSPESRRRAGVVLALTLAVPGACWVFGTLRMRDIDARRASAQHVKVGLVQPGTEARERWDEGRAAVLLDRLATFTRSSESRGAGLTIWPESAFPYTIAATSRYDLVGEFGVLQPGVHGPVLTGLLMRDARVDGSYNSAVLVTDGRLSVPYHKMHLLAFGEGVPLADVFPWIRTTFARGLGLVPGDHQVAIESGPIRLAVLNCFEDTLPEAGREAMSVNPNLLVNITNDAWFYESGESELHLRLSVLRAIESRRDLVRAVNRGPTSWVDAAGRVRARWPGDLPGTLITEPALLEGRTVFSAVGDWPIVSMLTIVSFWLVYRHKTRGRRASDRAAPA